jgi:hypothetical protein
MTPPSDEGRSTPEDAPPGGGRTDPPDRPSDEPGRDGPKGKELTDPDGKEAAGEEEPAEPAALDTLLTALRARLPSPSSDPSADEAGRSGGSSMTADSS